MSVDFESLSDILKHPIRRKILLRLSGKKLPYVDLMQLVGIKNTGKFNYHLKILGDLIKKDQDGRYCLTEKGEMAVQLLQKFPEKKAQQVPLSLGDAALIGFAGAVLVAINPIFWSAFIMASLKMELPTLFSAVIGLSILAYALVVPGAIMWLLTVRRTNSHDWYDLFKPPFATFILLLILLITMAFLKVNIVAMIKSPPIPSDGGISYIILQIHLQLIFLWGLIFSFIGVVIAEFASKLWKRMML